MSLENSAGRFKSPKYTLGILSRPGGIWILDTLDVQVRHAQGIALDEISPRFNLIPHEDGEDLVGLDGVGHVNLQQDAGLRVHGRLPELFRVHLSQAFVTLDL